MKELDEDAEFHKEKERFVERAKYLIDRNYVSASDYTELAKTIYLMEKTNESKNRIR